MSLYQDANHMKEGTNLFRSEVVYKKMTTLNYLVVY